ncbi:Ferric-anguibactin receptor FatA [uncultured Comamonas sp.]|nr:Ferric-anguibactin receptor FatA [uncultured Comamonas sp.]
MPSLRLVFRVHPIAAALLSIGVAVAHAAPQPIDLPAQALTTSIQQLSRQSGLSIGGDAALLVGKTAPAVKGNLEPAVALHKLLAGSGLDVRFEDNKAVIGRMPVATLKEVVVKGQAPRVMEGSAELGYRPETAKTTGPWGDKQILDTPYSISVAPTELMENVIASNPNQIYQMLPNVQSYGSSSPYGDSVQTFVRGFYVCNGSFNGMNASNNGCLESLDPEELERIEVLNGADGFLYGGKSEIGGRLNYISKRPTTNRLTNLTVGNYGGSQYFVHADLGGPIDKDGRFGYRINAVTANGDTAVDHRKIKRNLISAAFDWKVTDDLLVQLNLARREFKQNGLPMGLWADTGLKLSDLPIPDAGKNYSQKWTFRESTVDRYGLNVQWTANDTLSFRTGVQLRTDDRAPFIYSPWATLYGDGTLEALVASIGPHKSTNKSGYFFIDANFDTGPLRHKLVAGFNAYFGEYSFTSDNWSSVMLRSSLNDPYVEKPVFDVVGSTPMYVARKTTYRSMMIGDQIQFSEKWSALAGINRTYISGGSIDKNGTKIAPFYEKWAATPTLSLIYKPRPWLTTYATYMETLTQGNIVSDFYKNANEVFSPKINKQVEIGAKANLGGMLLSVALFKINAPLSYEHYANPGDILKTLTQDGEQVNKGVEFSAVGKVTERLTVMGGATFFNAKQVKTSDPGMRGKVPAQIAEKMAKLYAEYQVPWASGLFLNGGVNWTDSFWADLENTDRLPARTVLDVGLRYETRINSTPVTGRLYISNLTNKSYWLANAALGEPRTVAFSLTTKF